MSSPSGSTRTSVVLRKHHCLGLPGVPVMSLWKSRRLQFAVITDRLLWETKARVQLKLASHDWTSSTFLTGSHRVLPGTAQKSATQVGLTPMEMSGLPWPQLTGSKVAMDQPDVKDTNFSR